ncbi:MAG TPA: hypothetical protein VM939_14440, partial [Gemmatimonadaceae bacterium]|nr:hypothetical protein [Gemmatimonadaceae bacterium]
MTATRDVSRAWSMMTVNWLVVAAISSFLACDSSSQPPTDPTPTPPVVVEPPFPVPESPLIGQPLSADVTVTVDAQQLRQTIQGFGASMRIFSDPHLIAASGGIENALDISASEENAVLEMMFKEIGLTRLRPIHQSSLSQASPGAIPKREWVFADGHIDLIRRSKEHGLKEWWLSPITLESWMNDSNVDAYVDTAMDLIRYWKAKGVELTYYSIINEPSNAEVRVSAEFVRNAVVLLGRRLRAEGLPTKIVIPDDVNPVQGAQKARFVLEDAEARQYVGAIASHLYGVP